MARETKIAIVGPGRLGAALALALCGAGYRVAEIICHKSPLAKVKTLARKIRARVPAFESARLDADLIWLCVPDRAISSVARALAKRYSWKTKIVFHSSGALASDELNPLRREGAAVASVHPLMTFVAGTAPSLEGVPFAIEGDARAVAQARKIARRLGAQPFAIRRQDKAIYHAWGAFASPLLIALLATAEEVGRAAGLSPVEAKKKILPIVRQTIANYAALGPAGALSGPLTRGDVEVVTRHIKALKKMPAALLTYLSLSRAGVEYLQPDNRSKLRKVLKP